MSRTPSISPAHPRGLREQSNSTSNSHQPASHRAGSVSSWKGVAQRRCISCHSLSCSCSNRYAIDPEEKKRRIDAISASTDFGKRRVLRGRQELAEKEALGRAAIVREADAAESLFLLELDELHIRATIKNENASELSWVPDWLRTFNDITHNLKVFSSIQVTKLTEWSTAMLLEYQHYLLDIRETLEDLANRERKALHDKVILAEDETAIRIRIINDSNSALYNVHSVQIPDSLDLCRSAQEIKAKHRKELEASCEVSSKSLSVVESDDRRRLLDAFYEELEQRRAWMASKYSQRMSFDTECLRERAIITVDCDDNLGRIAHLECDERTGLITAWNAQREGRIALEREAVSVLGAFRSEESSEWHALLTTFQDEGATRFKWECARHEERAKFETKARTTMTTILEEALSETQSVWNSWCDLLREYQADLSAQVVSLQLIESGSRESTVSLEAEVMSNLHSLERASRTRVAQFTATRLILSLETQEQIARSTLAENERDDFRSLVSLCRVCGQDAASFRAANLEERIADAQRLEKKSRKLLVSTADAAYASIIALFNKTMPVLAETEEVRMLRQSIACQISSFEGYTSDYIRTGRLVPTGQRAPLEHTPAEVLRIMQQTLLAADALDCRVNLQLCDAKRSSDSAAASNTKVRAIKKALREKLIWSREMREKAVIRLSDAKKNTKSARIQARSNLKMTRERAAASTKAVAAARNDLEDTRDRVREHLRRGSSKAAPTRTKPGAKRPR